MCIDTKSIFKCVEVQKIIEPFIFSCYTMSAINYWTIREVVFIRKTIELKTPIDNTQKAVVKQLNDLVGDTIRFAFTKDNKLSVTVYEEKLKVKAGRPVTKNLPLAEVEQMKADGKTNKEIYTELGISKSLFYLKMREYKNNNGH